MGSATGYKHEEAEQQVLLTIAVAVYRVDEPLLRRCLRSLESAQELSCEVILVDDGSPDRCPAILDEYARGRSWVQVIHTENRGLSGARNVGLDHARGEWVMFVDGDDYVLDGFVERVPELVRRFQDVDIIYLKHRSLWDLTDTIEKSDGTGVRLPSPDSFAVARAVVANDEFRFGIDNVMFASAWCKLFRRAFIDEHDCRFVVGVNKTQDRVFMAELLSYRPELAIADVEGYAYINNLNSVCHSYNPAMGDTLAHTYEVLERTVNRYYQGRELEEMREALVYARCVFMYNALDAMQLCPNGNPRYRHEFREFKAYTQGFTGCIDACDLSRIYGVRNKYLVGCLKRRLYAPAYYVSMLMMDAYLLTRRSS